MTRQFKTVLSEPVDDEQWRVLGEGAVYRLIADLTSFRITRPVLRSAESLQLDRPPSMALRIVQDEVALDLRIERDLAYAPADEVASAERGASR